MEALKRYDANHLKRFAQSLLNASGVEPAKSSDVAEILVHGDLLGHTTHGLAQLPGYLDALLNGKMLGAGSYSVVSDVPAAATWDGQWLPGPWLTKLACAEALLRAETYGTGTIVIRRSHHIACLAAYLEAVTDKGYVCIIQSSDPAVRAVAPFGGTVPILTPNPIAVGIPTETDPILIDVSMSIGTVGMARRLISKSEQAPFPWLLDGYGKPTTDPAVIDHDPKGSLMLLGGVEAGHKGYGLALMVEALTSGLGGHGRADEPQNWGASVMVQVYNPEAFGGKQEFLHQMTYLVDQCVSGPAQDPANPVRMPGQAALKRKRDALTSGVPIHPGILESLSPWCERFKVSPPSVLTS